MFYSQLSGRSCFITHTVMRRKFTFILRVLSEQRKTTQLSEGSSKQGAGGDAADYTWLLLEDGWNSTKLVLLSLFFFFLFVFILQKTHKLSKRTKTPHNVSLQS